MSQNSLTKQFGIIFLVKYFSLKGASQCSLFPPSTYTTIEREKIGGKNEAFDNLEQDIFKALENQKRRDILRLVGEKRGVTFTEILGTSKIPDSPTLSSPA